MNVRVNLLAIFVLSICSTCAHAQFDTVINLPENPNSPNPSGFSGNSIGSDQSIGGVDGETTQLNVSNGGTIGFNFEANSGAEVNISGGTVDSGFDAESGSTVNISGGEVGIFFDAFSGSTVNISGGTFGSLFDAGDGSTINISGGEFGNSFTAEDGSTINISGGKFGNDFDAFSGSSVSISGGDSYSMVVQLMISPLLSPLAMEMFLLERWQMVLHLFFQQPISTVSVGST